MTTAKSGPSLSSAPSEQRVEISSWCHSAGKRIFDVCSVVPLLFAALPLMALIAMSLKLTSEGPILFRQMRVGRGGREFQLLKFRTMADSNCQNGPGLTCAGDARVTSLGRILRRWKLDELPQLLNLLRGDMSLVGPRPDLAEFVRTLGSNQRRVLSLTPGITGWATLHFRKEEELLASIPPQQLYEYYVNEVLPYKIRLDLEYAARASFFSDVSVLSRTIFAIAR